MLTLTHAHTHTRGHRRTYIHHSGGNNVAERGVLCSENTSGKKK